MKFPKSKQIRPQQSPSTVQAARLLDVHPPTNGSNYFKFTVGLPPISGQGELVKKKKFQSDLAAIVLQERYARNKTIFHNKPLILQLNFSLGRKFSITDLDNLAKSTCDALKGHLFCDDKQITKLHVHKYPLPNGKLDQSVVIIIIEDSDPNVKKAVNPDDCFGVNTR